MVDWLIENPLIMALASIAWLAIFLFSKKKMHEAKVLEYIVEKGQFQVLREGVIDEAVKDAKKRGLEPEFTELLRMVRRKYGYNGVRLGHLYWMWDQIERPDDDVGSLEIPSFEGK